MATALSAIAAILGKQNEGSEQQTNDASSSAKVESNNYQDNPIEIESPLEHE